MHPLGHAHQMKVAGVLFFISWACPRSLLAYHGHAQGPFLHPMGMPMDPKHGHTHGLLCHSMGMPMATFATAWGCPWPLFVQDGQCPCPPLHQYGHVHDWQKCCVIWISKGLVF